MRPRDGHTQAQSASLQDKTQAHMQCSRYVNEFKAYNASNLEIFQNTDLHVIFKPENDSKHSRNALGKSIGEGKVLTYFQEVINTWFKVFKGLIWAQIRIVRA